jgi:hypothetical protein
MSLDPGSPESPPRSHRVGGVAAAAVALVLVFAAVRLTASPPPPQERQRADPTPVVTDTPELFDRATRGTLAGDAAWVSAVASLPALEVLPAERHVALATETPEERIALVLGRAGRDVYTGWLTGPAGASPEQMTLATPPSETAGPGPLALWDVPELSWTGGLLVVLAEPGDEVSFATGWAVGADGAEELQANRLPVTDGVVTAPVGPPVAAGGGSVFVQRNHDGIGFPAPLSDRALRVAQAPIDVADPRGLRGSVDEAQLQELLHEMAGAYGLAPRMISPLLLATGPVGDYGDRAILVGATMLSGATVAWLGVGGTGNASLRTVATIPAPAGTALVDRVIAVPAGWAVSRIPLPPSENPPGWLVISGPRTGTTAELLGPHDDPLATLPLVDGAGVGPVPSGTTAVRLRDAAGADLGRAPLAELPG